MLVCAIDPGASAGWACGESELGCNLATEFEPAWQERTFAIAATELQFQSRSGWVSRNGLKRKVSQATVPALAFTAGFQLAQPRALKRLGFEPKVWRGLLWADGALGKFGLSKEACLERLSTRLGAAAAGLTEDEVEAYGLWLAACAVGNAASGQLKDGQSWKLERKPWGFKVKLEATARRSAKRFLKQRRQG